MRTALIMGAALALAMGLSACGKNDKDSAARDAEIQKTLQEGSQRERQMYEGMQKGVENLEKQSSQKPDKTQ
jgi:outer membrane protein assembly factor BamE (lipoprotein component of BamABCDE complex)